MTIKDRQLGGFIHETQKQRNYGLQRNNRAAGTLPDYTAGTLDHEYPYVVPVSFGMEVKDGTAVVYFHGAKAGQKVWLLDEDSRVCVEADILDKIEETKTGITARYESVIGFGNAVQVADKEKIRD